MKKHFTHVIDEEAVEIFKATFPKAAWTIYDIRPDYGKDHKVELVEEGEHTGLTFWVQVKGQKKIRKLKDRSVSFKLETKDLEYQTKLTTPLFLIVIDVSSRVGYWVFMQQYERTQLKNVDWRSQEHIQIRLPDSNRLSDLGRFREAVKDAIRYMTGLAFHSDISSEKKKLESRDPRFRVDITVNTEGRHYHFHSDEIIPIEFCYKDGKSSSGKIEDMLDRGVPVIVRRGEIEIKGSPLFEEFFDLAGDGDIRLQSNRVHHGYVNLLKTGATGTVLGRIDAIPCTITCGRKEARIEARLLRKLLTIELTVPNSQNVTSPMSMSVDLSDWKGLPLMGLPLFEPMAAVFCASRSEVSFALECFVPGQRVFSGNLNFDEEQPYPEVSYLLESLKKARAVAAYRGINPTIPEDYNTRIRLDEIEEIYEILLGEGHRVKTPKAKVWTTVERGGLRKFLDDIGSQKSLGTLNLSGNGSFPLLGESIAVTTLERIVTEVRLVGSWAALRDELKRFPQKRKFRLDWLATEATETVLRARKNDVSGSSPMKTGIAG